MDLERFVYKHFNYFNCIRFNLFYKLQFYSQRAPHKVYVWLVSAYANLSFLGIILLHNVIRILIIPEFDSSIVSIVHPRETFEHLMTVCILTIKYKPLRSGVTCIVKKLTIFSKVKN